MLHSSLTIFSVALIILSIFGIVYFWRNKGWFVQWLKGSVGFFFIAIIIITAFILSDLLSYKQLAKERPIATIRIFEMGKQDFDVTVVTEEGKEKRFQVNGDQWQLDVRLLTWNGPFSQSGVMPLYRLDRLSGRYLSLEQERTEKRSVYGLSESRWFDFWSWLKDYSFWLDAHYGSAVFMPLSNGAVYSVLLTPKGMVARPLNDAAEDALAQPW